MVDKVESFDIQKYIYLQNSVGKIFKIFVDDFGVLKIEEQK